MVFTLFAVATAQTVLISCNSFSPSTATDGDFSNRHTGKCCFFLFPLLFPEKKKNIFFFRKLQDSPSLISVITRCCLSACLCCRCLGLPALLVNLKRMRVLSQAVCPSRLQLDPTWLSSSCMLHGKWKHKKGVVYLFIPFKSCMRTFPLGVRLRICLSPPMDIKCRMPSARSSGHFVPDTNSVSIFFSFFSRILDFGLSAQAC